MNIFILSGDRHRGGFYKFKTVGNNNIYEFTSSSLNLPIPFNTEEEGPLRIGSTYRKANFGVVRFFEDEIYGGHQPEANHADHPLTQSTAPL